MIRKRSIEFPASFEIPAKVMEMVNAVSRAGGWVLLVGGGVRDLLLERPFKDLDFEVHRLETDTLEEVLGRFGTVDLVGKQFGVFKVHGIDADWAVPRKDSKGRHPVVTPDPWMGLEEAARRRDLTLNAMAVDLLAGELLDPFNGEADLNNKVLRVSDARRFPDDPLRLFRVMAFTGRFEMTPDKELSALCRDMDLTGIARERIEDEFSKLWLKSARPSLGLRWLESIGRLAEILPEAVPMIGLHQDPLWHPEGDVWQHTLQVLDAAAGLRIGDIDQDLMLLWAALCHDLGKIDTTVEEGGRIRSLGHTDRSGEIAKVMLKRIVSSKAVYHGAVKLAHHHLKPHDFFANHAKDRGFKRLALALSPETTLDRLAALALADFRGRNPKGDLPLLVESRESAWFLEKARSLSVEKKPEEPVLKGRHLLDVMKPGPGMGELLRKAYEIQLEEGVRDLEELKRRVLGDED